MCVIVKYIDVTSWASPERPGQLVSELVEWSGGLQIQGMVQSWALSCSPMLTSWQLLASMFWGYHFEAAPKLWGNHDF